MDVHEVLSKMNPEIAVGVAPPESVAPPLGHKRAETPQYPVIVPVKHPGHLCALEVLRRLSPAHSPRCSHADRAALTTRRRYYEVPDFSLRVDQTFMNDNYGGRRKLVHEAEEDRMELERLAPHLGEAILEIVMVCGGKG
jgi:hypothetical protein